MLEIAGCIELKAARYETDSHPVCDFARHHHEVAGLNLVHELVELGGKVEQAFLTPIGHNFLKMCKHGISICAGAQIADIQKARKQLTLVDRRELPLPICPPLTIHSLVMPVKKVSIYVTAHPLYKPLKLNNSFRANCSGMMPLSLLAAAIRIACS